MNQTQNQNPKIQNPKSKILWFIIFAIALAWRSQNLDAFGPFNDEGAHLMWARLAVEGYPLYSETQAVQSPLFLEWVGLAFRLAGQSIPVGRGAMLVGFGLLAVALSWLAHRAGGWFSALAALALLGLAPLIFTFSRLVMAEVPATGLAVLSVALLFVFLDRSRKGWLIASGIALGLSFITKALNPFVAVPIGLLLLMRSNPPAIFKFCRVSYQRPDEAAPACKHAGSSKLGPPLFDGQSPLINGQGWRWRALLLDGLLWIGGVFIPLAAIWFIYDPAAMYDQLLAFRADLRAALPHSWPETWGHFTLFFKTYWGFWLLAWGGIIWAVLRPRLYPFIWLAWLMAGIIMLLWHTPLFAHHFIVLLPPLILLAAGFIADVLALWGAGKSANRSLTAAVLSLLIIAAAFNVPAMLKANQKMAGIVTGGRETEAMALLQAVSKADDFVMGDSQLLIFMANRRTPPPLGDVALVAIKAGRQTSTRMIDLTRHYQTPAVVQWSLRLPWLPEYLAWVEANYLARRRWDSDHIIYFAPRFPAGQVIPNQSSVQLGDALTLRGYQINEAPLAPGRNLNLKVYWHTQTPLSQDYTIFTQLLDSSGALVAGWDSQPLGGHFPTGRWPPGEIITDIIRLPLPPNLPAGNYTLVTGMYLLDTLERLSTPAGRDHVILTTVRLPG